MTTVKITSVFTLSAISMDKLQPLVPYEIAEIEQGDGTLTVKVKVSLSDAEVNTVIEALKTYLVDNLVSAKIDS